MGPAKFIAARGERQEGLAAGFHLSFQPGGAVAIAASPRLGAVQVAATAAIVRVFDLNKIKMFFPVGTLFLKRLRTKAGLNPTYGSVVHKPRLLHVAYILVAGDRTFAQRAVFNCFAKRLLVFFFEPCFN